jgi:hypothetical protein
MLFQAREEDVHTGTLHKKNKLLVDVLNITDEIQLILGLKYNI